MKYLKSTKSTSYELSMFLTTLNWLFDRLADLTDLTVNGEQKLFMKGTVGVEAQSSFDIFRRAERLLLVF